MKKTLTILLLAFALCSCESQDVREGRKACEYALSHLYYEYKITNETITRKGDNVEYRLTVDVRKKGGEPLKTKFHTIVTNGSSLVSIE